MKKLKLILIAFLLMVAATNTTFAQHFKKDGSPDRRFKENKSYYSAPTYSSHHSIRYIHRLLLFEEIPEVE
jgi:hypothetical protein